MSDELEAELRAELTDAFENADYPVKNQMGLVPALPNGPATKFEAGDGEVSFTAMELASKLSGNADFPYDDVESLVDDIIEGLKDDGTL
ncbi:MTH865 family protein [Salarchaeum japonicum]|uniref:MTH865 family protein n=1 Tax=Salarchaeum japonicum TaxID=555573 RepID=A0AAV3SWI5_9EURY|nr:MTH865 family protein [Salarchaeum japonicum]